MAIRVKYKEIEIKRWTPISDGWHICKSAMIVLLIAAIFFGNGLQWWHFPILGTVWNVTFNLFYNRIMKR